MEELQPTSEPVPVPAVPESESIQWRQFARDLIETLVLAILLYLGINAISARVKVDGYSMVPTLQNGEYVLVSKVSYRIGEPQRGDIIVFKYPSGMVEQEERLSLRDWVIHALCSFHPSWERCPGPQDLIKRIIGLPGDVVEVKNANVYINGQLLSESYIAAAPIYQGRWEVPEGQLFVLGDNRNESSDSHSWGLLPMENVIGKALLIYWPPLEWNMINHAEVTAAATPPVP